MVRLFAAFAVLSIASCVAEPILAEQTISVGTFDSGYLRAAAPLADRGEGFRRLRPREPSRYGTPTLIGAIERAARAVQQAFPGGHPLGVGDLSAPRGGAHARHRSHRSGRDADLVFFARSRGGLSVPNDRWMRFDRFGLGAIDGEIYDFDEARNWHLVRTLLMDEEARVKWLFCSNELKARLLRYAVRHETSPQALLRATWVLHEPSRGRAHDDHFHLRVGCSLSEASLGCMEQAPHWPWLSDPASKEGVGPRLAASDRQIVRWLLTEQREDQRRDVTRGRFGITAKPPVAAFR